MDSQQVTADQRAQPDSQVNLGAADVPQGGLVHLGTKLLRDVLHLRLGELPDDVKRLILAILPNRGRSSTSQQDQEYPAKVQELPLKELSEIEIEEILSALNSPDKLIRDEAFQSLDDRAPDAHKVEVVARIIRIIAADNCQSESECAERPYRQLSEYLQDIHFHTSRFCKRLEYLPRYLSIDNFKKLLPFVWDEDIRVRPLAIDIVNEHHNKETLVRAQEILGEKLHDPNLDVLQRRAIVEALREGDRIVGRNQIVRPPLKVIDNLALLLQRVSEEGEELDLLRDLLNYAEEIRNPTSALQSVLRVRTSSENPEVQKLALRTYLVTTARIDEDAFVREVMKLISEDSLEAAVVALKATSDCFGGVQNLPPIFDRLGNKVLANRLSMGTVENRFDPLVDISGCVAASLNYHIPIDKLDEIKRAKDQGVIYPSTFLKLYRKIEPDFANRPYLECTLDLLFEKLDVYTYNQPEDPWLAAIKSLQSLDPKKLTQQLANAGSEVSIRLINRLVEISRVTEYVFNSEQPRYSLFYSETGGSSYSTPAAIAAGELLGSIREAKS